MWRVREKGISLLVSVFGLARCVLETWEVTSYRPFPIPQGLDYIGIILGLYRDNGKENGNYRGNRDHIGIMLGLYRDNGKENGN